MTSLNETNPPAGANDVSGGQEIFVRAHTVIPPETTRPGKGKGSLTDKWPELALVFDTETTIDTRQTLNFGAYRLCELRPDGYECIEEGLFRHDTANPAQLDILRKYIKDPENPAGNESFPPQMELKLLSRSDFVEYVFWKTVRKGGLVVGFNLPFDISRIAIQAGQCDAGGWSFVLSEGKNSIPGRLDPDPLRPHVTVRSLNGKMAFIGLSSKWLPEEWPQGRFLDLRTLGWALRDSAFSLKTAGSDKGFSAAVRKMKSHKLTGLVTAKEIEYCRQDVEATASLLNAMKKEFDLHPLKRLLPEKAYSSASIAKAYLDEMQIAHPKTQFQVSDKNLGVAMQGYYGGRAECRIRKTSVPVVHTDFTSQYPTVNALLGNWPLLKAKTVIFKGCKREVQKMLLTTKLGDTFDPAFWKQLSFFALVQPEQDVLPVRAVYNGRTQNIGLNYLRSAEPIWYAGPDLVGSVLLTGKVPRILKAVRMFRRGQQSGLKATNIRGMVPVRPVKDDFFRHVIEQKNIHKPKDKSLSHFLKILANAGSYGLFVEINQEKLDKPVNVEIFSGEIAKEKTYRDVEKSGHWYFPPLASLITAGGRLLLAMLERCVTDIGGSYLFCDTDSMCIVATVRGGSVPCAGGKYMMNGSREAIKALSSEDVDAIAAKFNKLNPYNPDLVQEILKIEDVNHIDSNPKLPRRQLFGYAISAKRYALYTRKGARLSVIKASGHGLGYLYSPVERADNDDEDEGEDVPLWISEAWEWLLRKEFGLRSIRLKWIDLPAMMRMAVTSPNVMRGQRPEWLSAYNFFLFPLLSELGGFPVGCDRANFRFITPYESNPKKWNTLEGINLRDERSYKIGATQDREQTLVIPETLRIILRQYFSRPEAKSLAPDGQPCGPDTHGLLRRASVIASIVVPVGKETDRRWDQGDDFSLLDFKVLEYRESGKQMVATPAERQKGIDLGVRETMRRTKLAQKTIYKILQGKMVYPRALATYKRGLEL